MQTQFQQFKSHFPELTTSLSFFTEDCELITFIDTNSNQLEFTRTVTARCGCCSDSEQFDDDLDHFIDALSETDFHELMEELKSKHK